MTWDPGPEPLRKPLVRSDFFRRSFAGWLGPLLTGLLIAAATNAGHAQQRLLTIDDIYDPGSRVNFSGNPAPAITWIDGTHYAWNQNGDWLKIDAANGSANSLVRPGKDGSGAGQAAWRQRR